MWFIMPMASSVPFLCSTEKTPPNYLCPRQQQPSLDGDTTIVWKGSNPRSEQQGCDLYLYKFRWPNPRPELEISSIDFSSMATQATPFLLATTAE